MSNSLTQLFGNLVSPMGVQQPSTPDTIYNPEIPDANLVVRRAIQDHYYTSMKLPTNSIRNGDGYTFSARGGSQRYSNPRDDAFGLDGGIDPLSIRRKTDPNGIPPRNFATGALYDIYSLPKTAYTAQSNLSLLQQSAMTYQNYINRGV